jgi:DNA-binding response OmpR family regulator
VAVLVAVAVFAALGVAEALAVGLADAEGDGLLGAVRRAGSLAAGVPAAGGVGGAGGVGCTAATDGAALITCTPGLTPASLTTMFAPDQARPTARAVPASQAARPVSTRVMSAIMPHIALPMHTVPTMARVLIIEDDPSVRSAIAADLTQRAHAVRTAGTALDGIREVSNHPPEVIVLDLGLPDLDGQQALKMMRAITTTPVIIATARHEEAEIIRLLNAGADDYLVKPFSCEHLAARISAQLRRAGSGSAASVVSAGGLRIDLARREAVLDGRPLELSRREFDLLTYLAARPGVVVSRQELLTEVWHQSYGDDQTIDVHVSWLRRKLGETAARPRYLRTVRGIGVMLDPPQ